jgi:hypothetical protein
MIVRLSGIAILFGATSTALPALAGPAGPGTGGLALTRTAEIYRVMEVRNRAGVAVAGAITGGIVGGIIASQGGFGFLRPIPIHITSRAPPILENRQLGTA